MKWTHVGIGLNNRVQTYLVRKRNTPRIARLPWRSLRRKPTKKPSNANIPHSCLQLSKQGVGMNNLHNKRVASWQLRLPHTCYEPQNIKSQKLSIPWFYEVVLVGLKRTRVLLNVKTQLTLNEHASNRDAVRTERGVKTLPSWVPTRRIKTKVI